MIHGFRREAGMNRDQFCLTDAQFSKIEPHLPMDTRGKARVDDRRSNVFLIATSCMATRAMTPMQSVAESKNVARFHTSRPRPTANGRTASLPSSTATATPSSACSAASRISVAWRRVTIATPSTSSPPSASQRSSATGYESGP